MALVLSAAIGLERDVRQKDAGLRTHTLVGIGSALFMLISKYGFTDVLEGRLIVLDPSRMAAQIVSGIGFIGAGLIFVRRDAVRGLTTAAGIWVAAAARRTTWWTRSSLPTARMPMSSTGIRAGGPVYPDLDQGVSREVLTRTDELRPVPSRCGLVRSGQGPG